MSALMNRRQWLKTGTLAAVGVAIRPESTVLASPTPAPSFPLNKPLRLHSNENPYGPSESARRAMQVAFDEGNLYPHATYKELQSLIAQREGLTPDHVVLGAGSHEILRMTAMAYGLAGGEILTAYPTYEGMENYARTIGAHVHRIPLDDDFLIDLDLMDRRTTQAVKLVFVCNPNNPTGTVLPGQRVQAFCEEVARRSVVFVDEAYYELVEDPDYYSMTALVRDGHNVIVSRTFSKIFGLAGLRIGYGLARPDIAARLRTFETGAGKNVLGIRAAIAAYQDPDFIAFSRSKNAEARTYVTQVLEELGHRCLPSHTNFVFFHLKQNIRQFRANMERRGILVGRPFPPFLDWCRLSLGTPEQMHTFVGAFRAEMSTP
ncbi:MAG: pyridoxal phosphate-dependent aminotransferase [Rhodothermales bacterium]